MSNPLKTASAHNVQHVKPLFIPLKGCYFDAFADGSKTTEYRPFGKRWNGGTCWIGRPVVLSRGYGKQRRLAGKVIGFSVDERPQDRPGWLDCYGTKHSQAACISIEVAK